MTLLPPGRVFLDHARAILAAVDRAVDAARAEQEVSPPPPPPKSPDTTGA
jgi:DNA-binding transcriptional LysR family regulator